MSIEQTLTFCNCNYKKILWAFPKKDSLSNKVQKLNEWISTHHGDNF